MEIPEWIYEIGARPDGPTWRDFVALGIAVICWRLLLARHAQTEQIAALLVAQRHQADVERYRDSAELHRALASLLADAFGSPTRLLIDSLTCAVVPSPFLVTTRADGTRIYVTQQPRLLRRVGIVRRVDRSTNLTRGVVVRRAAMRAVWEAVSARADVPQPSLPLQKDWYAMTTGATRPHRFGIRKGAGR